MSKANLPSETELLDAFIGTSGNTYYRLAFRRLTEKGARWRGAWNWTAFFFTAHWLFYRRLWGKWVAYTLCWALFGALVAVAKSSDDNVAFVSGVLALGLFLAMYIVPGWRGTVWYYERSIKQLAMIWEAFKDDPRATDLMLREARYAGRANLWHLIAYIGLLTVMGVLTAPFSR